MSTPKHRWYQYSLKMLLVGMTLLSVFMALVYYVIQGPRGVVLKGKSGTVCRIYPDWWYDNGATVFCDLVMNGKEVVHGEAIGVYNGDQFPTDHYSLAEIDDGKTVVIFSLGYFDKSPSVIFVYKEGSGVLHISAEQEEQLKEYYSPKQE